MCYSWCDVASSISVCMFSSMPDFQRGLQLSLRCRISLLSPSVWLRSHCQANVAQFCLNFGLKLTIRFCISWPVNNDLRSFKNRFVLQSKLVLGQLHWIRSLFVYSWQRVWHPPEQNVMHMFSSRVSIPLWIPLWLPLCLTNMTCFVVVDTDDSYKNTSQGACLLFWINITVRYKSFLTMDASLYDNHIWSEPIAWIVNMQLGRFVAPTEKLFTNKMF